jgi:hypothetical protein
VFKKKDLLLLWLLLSCNNDKDQAGGLLRLAALARSSPRLILPSDAVRVLFTSRERRRGYYREASSLLWIFPSERLKRGSYHDKLTVRISFLLIIAHSIT